MADTLSAPVTDTHEAVAFPDAAEADPGASALVEEELLVEEISIDGMCGVY